MTGAADTLINTSPLPGIGVGTVSISNVHPFTDVPSPGRCALADSWRWKRDDSYINIIYALKAIK